MICRAICCAAISATLAGCAPMATTNKPLNAFESERELIEAFDQACLGTLPEFAGAVEILKTRGIPVEIRLGHQAMRENDRKIKGYQNNISAIVTRSPSQKACSIGIFFPMSGDFVEKMKRKTENRYADASIEIIMRDITPFAKKNGRWEKKKAATILVTDSQKYIVSIAMLEGKHEKFGLYTRLSALPLSHINRKRR